MLTRSTHQLMGISMNANLIDSKLSVIGLGYVGLPLALAFGQKYQTVGYDINRSRVASLVQGIDATKEVLPEDFKTAEFCQFSSDDQLLADRDVYIVTVPTPIDKNNRPDLSPLMAASRLVGKYLDRGNVVVFESTVFPGATEEVCVPILEEVSGLKFNEDFFAGYSPERINPGDKDRRLKDIVKVTSGSTPETAGFVDSLYASIIDAGTFRAKSIAVAEAAKVIENTQRDVNIALINELSVLFNRLSIDTKDVLDAAATKWNFLNFRPGLVGGHCIGVDPYYLTFKAQEVGHHPEIILAGRRINDGMPNYVAERLLAEFVRRRANLNEARILVLGITFKENCPDIRNSKVVELIRILSDLGLAIDVYDPHADKSEVLEEYGIVLTESPSKGDYKAVICAVAHDEFKQFKESDISAFGSDDLIVYDLKYLFPSGCVDIRL